MILNLSFFKTHGTSLFLRPKRNVASENHSVHRQFAGIYIVSFDTRAFISITLSESTHNGCFSEWWGTDAHYICNARIIREYLHKRKFTGNMQPIELIALAVFFFLSRQLLSGMRKKSCPPVDRRKRSSLNLFLYSPLFSPLLTDAGANGEFYRSARESPADKSKLPSKNVLW